MITLKLSKQDIAYLGELLAQRPYGESNGIISRLNAAITQSEEIERQQYDEKIKHQVLAELEEDDSE